MSSDTPIACTLTPAEMPERLAEMAALGKAALIDVTEGGGHALLRFRAEEGIQRRLEAIIAAESQCCAFLDMSLEAGADALVLSVAGPADAAPIIEQMSATFAGSADAGR